MKEKLAFLATLLPLVSLMGQTVLPTLSETLHWDFQDSTQASGAV